MRTREAPSSEQKRYVAAVCPEYNPMDEISSRHEQKSNIVTCEVCTHWDDGECDIFDEVLTGIDQT